MKPESTTMNGSQPPVTRTRMTESDQSTSKDFMNSFHNVLEEIVRAGSYGSKETAASEQLQQLFARHDLKALIALHQFVSKHRFDVNDQPTNERLVDLISQVNISLRQTPFADSVQELIHLINRPHMLALYRAHDDVANARYEPTLPEIPFEVDEDEVAVKVVRLVKNSEPLGATIKCEPDGSVVIARVIRGGVADRAGCIQVNDRVIEVNGVAVDRKTPKEIVKLLSSCGSTVTFKLIPADDDFLSKNGAIDRAVAGSSNAKPRVKAQIDYRPSDDQLHPCPEAGLSFRKGDILELVDCVDDHWWQARNEGHMTGDLMVTSSMDGRVGLIPSRTLQEKRAAALRRATESAHHSNPSVSGGGTLNSEKNGASKCGTGPRVKKVVYDTHHADELDGAETRSYEEVGLMYPRPDLTRPLVLIGPPGVGRNELKRRLLMLSPDRFATTIPHTSRAPRAQEADGVDYHFATRADMEHWVRQGRFLEYGEYKGNLYGTLGDSVRDMIEQGRTPVLNPHPQALRLLRNSEFKPFIIYVKPPPFPALKETRSAARARSTFEGGYRRGFSDDELEQMLSSAKQLERQYGHWFDYELVNGNMEFAFRELCELLQKIDSEPVFVPATWVR